MCVQYFMPEMQVCPSQGVRVLCGHMCVQCVYNYFRLKCKCVCHKESACYVGNVLAGAMQRCDNPGPPPGPVDMGPHPLNPELEWVGLAPFMGQAASSSVLQGMSLYANQIGLEGETRCHCPSSSHRCLCLLPGPPETDLKRRRRFTFKFRQVRLQTVTVQ